MRNLFHLIGFAIGIALYFALPFEPALAMPICFAILFAANAFVFRKKSIVYSLLFITCFGFFYSAAYTRNFGTTQIAYPLRGAEITGRVDDIDWLPDKVRLFIGNYRLSLSDTTTLPNIGDTVAITATLFPPNGADLPGGFDMAQWSYFHNISATGFITKISIEKSAPENSINYLRNYLHNKLQSPLFDSLVLGYKHTLTAAEDNAWKAAGINHVFSISGFHITLVGGWLFAIFYFLFRAAPKLTRRIPARFPATICAAAGLLFYLFLSGADVATQRAFLMTSLMFAAFIFGRNVFTMRNAGLVFAALLMLCPHYLLEPGFQMSFSAIFGMIWFFGKSEFKKTGWLKKIWRAIIIMLQTTIVCTIFTAPFVAYNFHSLPLYSLLGNLICLPIFSLLIMPLVMLCLTGWAASVYDWTLGIANWIAELPFAQIQIPTVPGIALIIAVCGLLILMFIQNKKNKYLAFAFCFLTFTLITAMNPKPLFYATADHELVAFMRDDGKLQFNRSKSSAHYFAFSAWQQSNYETITDQHTTIRKGFDGERYSVKCEKALCIYTTPEWSLAYTQKFMPLYRNMNSLCNNNDFLVSYLKIEAPDCKARTLQNGFVIYKSGRIKFTPNNRIWHRPVKKISE